MTSQNSDKAQDRRGIHAIGIFKAEVLVDVETGSQIEMTAREYLMTHPEVLKLSIITRDPKKIRAMKKAGCVPYSLGGRS